MLLLYYLVASYGVWYWVASQHYTTELHTSAMGGVLINLIALMMLGGIYIVLRQEWRRFK